VPGRCRGALARRARSRARPGRGAVGAALTLGRTTVPSDVDALLAALPRAYARATSAARPRRLGAAACSPRRLDRCVSWRP
jgi:hypothetical protein